MTGPSFNLTCRTALVALLLTLPGCNVLKRTPDGSRYQPVGTEFQLSSAQTADDYLAVKQARAQNGVVLQIVGDAEPNRILPLPSGGKRVFVSNLLQETGLIKRLENMDVVLYRVSPDTIGGIQMDVKMNREGNSVRPESDYALQPGDKIRVTKIEKDAMQAIIDMTLGR